MVDFHKELVGALNTVLPTQYEMALTSEVQLPIITYLELSNNVYLNGDTLGYSDVVYQIKVWGTQIADIQKYAKQIDDVLRPLGLVRSSSGEMYDTQSTLIQKIMTYRGLALEQFNMEV